MSASLLARMNIDTDSIGPQRSKSRGNHSTSPYSRPPKGDINSRWTHDQFNTHNSLLDRIDTPTRTAPPKTNFAGAVRALNNATGVSPTTSGSGISILGASMQRNVVEVSGLVKGTTADDVQAIFKQCGTITDAKNMPSSREGVTVRLTFKLEKDAADAVRKFDKQVADGRELKVTIVGGVNTTLVGRLGYDTRQSGSVDALLPSSGESKLRSDDILRDAEERARAHVLVAPPGANPRDYTVPTRGRGRGGARRRGGGGRNRNVRGGERMDTD